MTGKVVELNVRELFEIVLKQYQTNSNNIKLILIFIKT